MNFPLILRTVRHLRPTQVVHQVLCRVHKPGFRPMQAPESAAHFVMAEWIAKPVSWLGEGRYSFLNLEHRPDEWCDASLGMLWAYNLNYMDYLLQPGLAVGEGLALIYRFIDDLGTNRVGLDPYPIALRGINWIKWLAANAGKIDSAELKKINDSLYSQYILLEKKTEWHLMGNHLLEDAYSLTIAAVYFGDIKLWRKASKLLRDQLDEQVLADGAHYEQSPMYHCILLDRLLDVYNASVNNLRFGSEQQDLNAFLASKAVLMLGHLESIAFADGALPMFNDSAIGIAPKPDELKAYARRLGLEWRAVDMKECGYRHLGNGRMEAIADIGGIAASYQPGHSHADTFNFELHIDGKPFVVDTGISTYDKTPRRQYERSTLAHNTVSVGGKDSSEVWGGFRVGRRARVKVMLDTPQIVEAAHDGYRQRHTRRFVMDAAGFAVSDTVGGDAEAVSVINLAPDVRVLSVSGSRVTTDRALIEIEGASSVAVEEIKISKEYNKFMPTHRILISFRGVSSYKIIPDTFEK